ncbi:hypothetical protein POM88_041447 [Heracleum sosnowskyi]|uniref:Uncharacterized protein n=1 Tax=Heracleum sosnowskyi TaxID=360622 RepID=A0AAD8HF09_9APIA|nr:hypothetical protein POM88_041447 [Heracleum sosnowskyi]
MTLTFDVQHSNVQSTGNHFRDYPCPLDFHGSHGFNSGASPPGHLAQSSVGYLRPRVGSDSSYAHSQVFLLQVLYVYMAPPQLPGPRGGNHVRAAQSFATQRHARALNTVEGSNTPADIVAPAQAPVPGNAPVEKTIMGTCFNDSADEKGFKVQHNQGTYSFFISPRFGVEDENGVMVCKLPGVGSHEEKLSAKHFEEKELTGGMQKSRLYYFVPTASFRKGEKIIGVGNFLGKTVKE